MKKKFKLTKQEINKVKQHIIDLNSEIKLLNDKLVATCDAQTKSKCNYLAALASNLETCALLITLLRLRIAIKVGV